MKALASLMTWKTAVVDDPVRRRQGRHQVRPAHARRSASCERLTRRFIDQIEQRHRADARHPRARRQHQRPDDGVDDGQVRQAARPHAGVVTGKPIALGAPRPRGGDRPRRRPSDPRGGAALGLQPADCRVVLQGFGNVGSWAARIIAQLGATVIAVSDAHGRRPRRGRARPRGARAARARGRQGRRVRRRRRRGDHRRGAARARVRGAHPRGARRHDPRRQRGPAEHPHRRRGRQLPDHPGRPTRSWSARASTSCPT